MALKTRAPDLLEIKHLVNQAGCRGWALRRWPGLSATQDAESPLPLEVGGEVMHPITHDGLKTGNIRMPDHQND